MAQLVLIGGIARQIVDIGGGRIDLRYDLIAGPIGMGGFDQSGHTRGHGRGHRGPRTIAVVVPWKRRVEFARRVKVPLTVDKVSARSRDVYRGAIVAIGRFYIGPVGCRNPDHIGYFVKRLRHIQVIVGRGHKTDNALVVKVFVSVDDPEVIRKGEPTTLNGGLAVQDDKAGVDNICVVVVGVIESLDDDGRIISGGRKAAFPLDGHDPRAATGRRAAIGLNLPTTGHACHAESVVHFGGDKAGHMGSMIIPGWIVRADIARGFGPRPKEPLRYIHTIDVVYVAIVVIVKIVPGNFSRVGPQ